MLLPKTFRHRSVSAALGLLLWCPCAYPATWCVNTGGTGGCKSSISAAVAAAAPNDTVRVSRGTYHEAVVVTKPLSLIGDGSENVVIDATGLANGVNIDGHNHAGLSHVSVTGFTVANANFEGILITDSSYVTVANNHVTGSDKSLSFPPNAPPQCPGLPAYFIAFQSFDCGEGIHLSGVNHSTVANNLVDKNAGGILVSDDTGPTHDNLITANTVQNNPFDCGITIASHIVIPVAPQQPLRGIYHNTIQGNTSSSNGLKSGEGAGIGLFAAAPGAQNWGNVIVGNTSTGNALPGVAMHSHSPLQNLNDNLIVGNQISANGPDSDPGVTVPIGIDVFADEANGAAPITGTVITGNVIKQEGIDVVVATSGGVTLRFNSLFGDVGVSNLGTGAVDATLNWWKCSGGPGANGCTTASGTGIMTAPWLSKPQAGQDN
jgi:parallel beta-helix repeat protein